MAATIKKYKGKFITFEGSEGSGKSTQINLLHRYLKKKKRKVLFVREPGGVKISEKIRQILLDAGNIAMGQECEVMLYMAARAQLVEEVIEPALKRGEIVLCDRFLDSTVVYQGYGHGIDIKMIKEIGRYVTRGLSPDLTFLFDIPARTGLSRLNRAKDRIERRALSYHNRVRNGYLKIARAEPGRIKCIKANQSRETIFEVVRAHTDRLLG